MRSLVAVSLVLVCFMDHSDGAVVDFMKNLPSEVAKAFGIAWGSLVDAFKHPFQTKRLVKESRRSKTVKLKATTTASPFEVKLRQLLPESSSRSELKATTTARPFAVELRHLQPESSSRSGRKLMIPYLRTQPRIINIGNKRYILQKYD